MPGNDVWGDIIRADISQWKVNPSPPSGGDSGTDNGGSDPPDTGGSTGVDVDVNSGTTRLAPGMGENNPLAEPRDHVCPINWDAAQKTLCTSDQLGLCL